MHEFLARSAAHYETEKAHRDAVTPLLKTLLRRGLAEGRTISYSTARTVVSVPLLFFKSKNKIDTGVGDATIRAGSSYHNYWLQNKVLAGPFPFALVCLLVH